METHDDQMLSALYCSHLDEASANVQCISIESNKQVIQWPDAENIQYRLNFHSIYCAKHHQLQANQDEATMIGIMYLDCIEMRIAHVIEGNNGFIIFAGDNSISRHLAIGSSHFGLLRFMVEEFLTWKILQPQERDFSLRCVGIPSNTDSTSKNIQIAPNAMGLDNIRDFEKIMTVLGAIDAPESLHFVFTLTATDTSIPEPTSGQLTVVILADMLSSDPGLVRMPWFSGFLIYLNKMEQAAFSERQQIEPKSAIQSILHPVFTTDVRSSLICTLDSTEATQDVSLNSLIFSSRLKYLANSTASTSRADSKAIAPAVSPLKKKAITQTKKKRPKHKPKTEARTTEAPRHSPEDTPQGIETLRSEVEQLLLEKHEVERKLAAKSRCIQKYKVTVARHEREALKLRKEQRETSLQLEVSTSQIATLEGQLQKFQRAEYFSTAKHLQKNATKLKHQALEMELKATEAQKHTEATKLEIADLNTQLYSMSRQVQDLTRSLTAEKRRNKYLQQELRQSMRQQHAFRRKNVDEMDQNELAQEYKRRWIAAQAFARVLQQKLQVSNAVCSSMSKIENPAEGVNRDNLAGIEAEQPDPNLLGTLRDLIQQSSFKSREG